jgi:hypothetical protein
MSRGVRFISPRSSEHSNVVVERSVQYDPPIPPTPKSVRFVPSQLYQHFSPPPRDSKATSIEIYEEFEYDDKPEQERHKKRARGSLSFLALHKGDKMHRRDKQNKQDRQDKHEKKEKKKMSTRRKCCFCCLCLLITFLVMLALIIILAVMMSRKHKSSSTTVVWTNITNYPGIPSGSLTIARPNLTAQQDACVVPLTVWSCAVPKEQQAAILPNDPDQPNFVLDVVYDNTTSLPITNKRSSSGAVLARAFGLLKRAMYTPDPGAPSTDEYTFLGQYTDNNSAPYGGEATPFYISLLEPGSTTPDNTPSKTKAKRTPQSAPSSSATVNVIPDLASAIPVPSLNPDGTPPPANLLAFPSYQPLRLFNRGLDTEHYAFYNYFDRSIFLRSNVISKSTEIIPADEQGGSTQEGANVRCTWSQTRLLVQIWTRKATPLLPHASSGSKISNGNFAQPGSFPYPVTITLDRHGGNPTTKMLYCFGLEATGALNTTARQFQPEDRAYGGTIVNPAAGPFGSNNVSIADGGPGGIDGGSGGCFCQWQNF